MAATPGNAFHAPLLPPGRWVVDPDASSVGFRVRHFRFATVEGHFTRFAGTVGAREASGSVEVASIDTGDSVRDERLRSADFLDAARFPRIVWEAAGAVTHVLGGRLMIREVSRPVIFEVEPAGAAAGTPRLRARAALSRKAFGLDWAGLREAGRLLVSDRVELLLDLAVVPASGPQKMTGSRAWRSGGLADER
jgi:polyisoprenoid-binding protein YceI